MPKFDEEICEQKDQDFLSYDDDNESDDDNDSDAEAEMIKRVQLNGRRGTVMAAPFEVKENWRPPVYKKTIAEKESIKNSIVSNFLFSTLDEEALEILVKAMQRVSFEDGDIIIKQRDEGDLFYVIEEGTCRVLVDGKHAMKIEGGSERNYFGELALLYDSPRAATVEADSDVCGWALDRVTFKKILMDSTMKKRQLYKEFLEEVPLLSTLTKHERLTIADAMRPVVFEANENIIVKGERGDKFYIIEEGEVKCTKDGDEISNRLNCGDYFGELALITDDTRKANVIAVTETKCLVMDRSTFKRLLGPLETLLRDNVELYDKYLS